MTADDRASALRILRTMVRSLRDDSAPHEADVH